MTDNKNPISDFSATSQSIYDEQMRLAKHTYESLMAAAKSFNDMTLASTFLHNAQSTAYQCAASCEMEFYKAEQAVKAMNIMCCECGKKIEMPKEEPN